MAHSCTQLHTHTHPHTRTSTHQLFISPYSGWKENNVVLVVACVVYKSASQSTIHPCLSGLINNLHQKGYEGKNEGDVSPLARLSFRQSISQLVRLLGWIITYTNKLKTYRGKNMGAVSSFVRPSSLPSVSQPVHQSASSVSLEINLHQQI